MHILKSRPACTERKRLSSSVWRGMMLGYILLLPSYTKKKKSVESLFFLTQKGAEECLKFREGWRVWNLSPRGQTGGFFSFQALIDSPLSSLATQKDTWKNFWWGCDVRNGVTCSADALSWFLTSTSARQRQYSWTFQLFPPPAYWRGLLKHSFRLLCRAHPSLHFREKRL